jgi:heat-inducible transcriptional repressor
MDDRKKRILQAVTDDYISTAEPVGSRTIARRYDLGISPATIRNEMADLEESGYLEQPHISAGRIPSQKGYRFYVDFIMQTKGVSDEERLRIRRRLEERKRELDLVTEETARILAQLSNYAAFVLSPVSRAAVLKRLELVQVDPQLVLVILVVDPGFVRTHLVMTERQLKPEQLAYINSYLNSRLRDIPLSKIGVSLLKEIAAELKEYSNVLEATLEAVVQLLEHRQEEAVVTDGQINILEQPEFREVERLESPGLGDRISHTPTLFCVRKQYTSSLGTPAVSDFRSRIPKPCSRIGHGSPNLCSNFEQTPSKVAHYVESFGFGDRKANTKPGRCARK